MRAGRRVERDTPAGNSGEGGGYKRYAVVTCWPEALDGKEPWASMEASAEGMSAE